MALNPRYNVESPCAACEYASMRRYRLQPDATGPDPWQGREGWFPLVAEKREADGWVSVGEIFCGSYQSVVPAPLALADCPRRSVPGSSSG